MSLLSMILIVVGLSLFEGVSSIDNAVINADILSGMGKKAQKWFLLWGLLFAVFVVRGLLPWLIVWFSAPSLGPLGAFTAALSGNAAAAEALARSSPLLLLGGGIFLLLLFLHWLFLEEKAYGFPTESFFFKQGAWFYTVASVFLAAIVWFAFKQNPFMAFATVLGTVSFFVIHGLRTQAEQQEKQLLQGKKSDLSKLLYLEAIDTTFSIDGVLGAFAFTFSIPLIIIGNGLGALLLRQLTVKNISRIKAYRYLKNGAMYSVFCLSVIMLSDGFGLHLPEWLSPVVTVFVVGYFFWKSKKELQRKSLKVPGGRKLTLKGENERALLPPGANSRQS